MKNNYAESNNKCLLNIMNQKKTYPLSILILTITDFLYHYKSFTHSLNVLNGYQYLHLTLSETMTKNDLVIHLVC